MATAGVQDPHLGEITCGSLLKKLQEIWDEVGESDEERDMMLLQIGNEMYTRGKLNLPLNQGQNFFRHCRMPNISWREEFYWLA
ncbi:hypothetical protein SAY87_004113 [Trapa incisa]|uniref:Uncharacterized protein n=1 Tax=Trapa incisa TaxID=236973 RepID=A0AAN7PLA6_9MYRT|nr:hypothetical protein SAY87_004113 [Trapa incisa]